MKKIILLCGILMSCISSYATITLTASPSSITAPSGTVTVTASGESSSEHITDVPSTITSYTTSPSGVTASGTATSVTYYNAGTGVSHTSFTFSVGSNPSTTTTVTYVMTLTTKNASGGIVNQGPYSFTVVVNPAPCSKPVISSTAMNGTTVVGGTVHLANGSFNTLTVNYTGGPLTSYSFTKNSQSVNITSQSNNGSTLTCTFWYAYEDTPPNPIFVSLTNSCGTTTETVNCYRQ